MVKIDDITAIVFDIGGTLFDLQQPETLAELSAGLANAYEDLLSAGHSLPSFSKYRRRILHRLLQTYLWSRIRRGELDPMKQLRVIHAGLGISLSENDLYELARRIYEPTKSIAHVHRDTPTALGELRKRGYKLAIISNTVAPPPGLDDHLQSEGVLEYFPFRIYSCVFGVPKPNPRIFREVLGKLSVKPHQAAYVGDKPRIDVKGAKRVGMMSILRTPKGNPVLPGPRSDYDINEIVDLLDIFPPRANA